MNPATPPSPSSGCDFATPGTGQYASKLCFVDFSPWDALRSAPPTNPNCQAGQLYMSADVANTPFILSFCMSVTSSDSGYVTDLGNSNPPGLLCTPNLQGWNDIEAVPLPTYTCPPTSEAFLGNNGFYTGVAATQRSTPWSRGSTAVVSFTNIQVLTSSGHVVANWQLATGDAESTDTSESITWHSDQNLTLLPNTSISPVGNACDSVGQYAPPGYNPNNLTGVGTTTVVCSSTVSADHTGSTMLAGPDTVDTDGDPAGGGLQAMFLGVMLP